MILRPGVGGGVGAVTSHITAESAPSTKLSPSFDTVNAKLRIKSEKKYMMGHRDERTRKQCEGREIAEFLSIDGWCQRVQLAGPKRGHEIIL